MLDFVEVLGLIQKKKKFIFLIFIFLIISTILTHSTPHYRSVKKNQDNDSTIVEKYGQLSVTGNKIVDKNGVPVLLRGMSLFWSQWEGARFYNASCLEWLRDDWKCTVVRAAMGVESGGYLQNPQTEKNKVISVIQACIDLGIYVIVDWHDHNAQNHTKEAIEFFTEIAESYGNYPNLIYEIFNEPLQVSWINVVKPYAETIIDTIRSIDPDNLIIVGTPTWSQDVDIAAQSPLNYTNIAYALHFYAATHKQSLRNKATSALNKGIALFVSEFGTCESNGSGFLDSAETNTWMNFMESNNLSWCNWSVVDKNETSAALKSGVSSNGNWPDSMLTNSGSLVREKIQFYTSRTTDVGKIPSIEPQNFRLMQNFPNPFNPVTTIEYELKNEGQVKLEIFNIKGSKIKTLTDDYMPRGNHKVIWNGSNDKGIKTASGVYFYSLFFENKILVKKAIQLN